MLVRSATRAASTSATAALSEGAAVGQASVSLSSSSSTSSVASTSTLSAYMLLSRPPTIIRSPTSFESAYHAYNSKIQRALAQPFPKDLYFKKGSAAESKFLQEEKARQRILTQSNTGSTSKQDSDSSNEKVEEQSLYTTATRRTKADEQGRIDTLERNLDRSLFLLVKGGEMGNTWTLPFAKVDSEANTSLHKAAPNAVLSMLGKDMDIWMVSTLPIGLLSKEDPQSKAYVMKGHILAGQPDSQLSSSNGVEYAWLTREEMQTKMSREQYEGLSDLLSA